MPALPGVRHRTPVRGLSLARASVHSGGGVHGPPGAGAARAPASRSAPASPRVAAVSALTDLAPDALARRPRPAAAIRTALRQRGTLAEAGHRPWPPPERGWFMGQSWRHLLF